VIKTTLIFIGKLLIGGLAFFLGSILGSLVAAGLGIPAPLIPGDIDPARIAQSLPLVGLWMAAILAIFSRQSNVSFFPRWIILGLFSWTTYGFNNYLEARLFSPEVATSYVLVNSLIACFLCSAAVAWLFKSTQPVEKLETKMRAFFRTRPVGSWVWRFIGSLAAFPVAYFVFGFLVSPYVASYYEQQYAGLALPTLGTMLWLSSIRSLLFLLCILPVLVIWKDRRPWALFLAMGLALFTFVGGIAMFQAAWLPPILRIIHSLEILADSFVHAAALIFLLVPRCGAAQHLRPITGPLRTKGTVAKS